MSRMNFPHFGQPGGGQGFNANSGGRSTTEYISGFEDLNRLAQANQPPSTADLINFGRGLGFQYNGTDFTRATSTPGASMRAGGATETFSTADLMRQYQQANPGNTFLDQMGSAVMGDAARQQAAADRQFTRNNEAIDGIRDATIRGANELRDVGNVDAERLRAVGDRHRSEFEAGASDVLRRFEDNTAEQISSSTAAIERRYQNESSMIRSGIRPDGSMMSPEEREAARKSLNFDMGNMINDSMVNIRTQFNSTMAQLGTALSGQRLQSQSIQADLEKVAAQFRSTSVLQAINFEMQGAVTIAEFVRNNPESVINVFSSLVAMAGIATAPGGRNLQPVRFA